MTWQEKAIRRVRYLTRNCERLGGVLKFRKFRETSKLYKFFKSSIQAQSSLFSSVIVGVSVHSGPELRLAGSSGTPELLAVLPTQLPPEEDVPPDCPVLATMITERGRGRL
jgi:hypothetical protein